MKSIICFVCLSFFWSTSIAQYGSVWYFGKNAGLDFKFTPPKVLYDGKINQSEGCAVICDQNGNMLLYTDGQTLWNRKHNVVANGTNLGGHPSATQSGIMVPLPGSTTLYYVFSVDYELNPGGLQYAIVDMSVNGGDGLVTSKNNKLKTPITEKLTAVKHKNGKDYWILTHEFNNNRFLAYLLTSAGLNTTPVTSDVGTAHKNTQGQGSLKVSQDSKMLAITDLLEFLLEIFEFDNSTGKISNPVTLVHSDYDRVYGIEFSPDGKKLYATRLQSPSRIYQFDLTTMTASAISASRKLVYEINLQYGLGSLQLGPDGKIYANQRNGFTYNDYLAVIEKPNETYPACNFKNDAVYLAPGGSWTGLPNVISSLLIPYYINFSWACKGDSTNFWTDSNISYDSIVWNFGDPLNSESRLASPSFLYSDTGTFTVALKWYYKSVESKISKQITIVKKPIVNLPNDTLLCGAAKISLDVTCVGCTYLWEDKSTNPKRTISAAGTYSVVISNGSFCSDSGKFNVIQFSDLDFDLGNDTVICEGDSILLTTPVASGIMWNDGKTSQTRYVKIKGLYKATITDSCGVVKDSIYLDTKPIPVFDLGKDTVLCEGALYTANLTSYPYSFQWHDSIVANFRTFQNDTTIWAKASVNGCPSSDILVIKRSKPINWIWPPDTAICLGTKIIVGSDNEYSTFLWSDGNTESLRSIGTPGNYSVNISSPCGNASESLNLTFEDCQCYVYVPNAFSPTLDNLNEVFRPIITCEVENLTFSVYNRWGELIFTSHSMEDAWNGYYMGEKVQLDAYIWVLDFMGKSGALESLHHLKGTVTVLY